MNVLEHLEKLKEYGIETIAWYHLLRPVISRFVATFDEPESPENLDFWRKIAHHTAGSGFEYYSGWINAFSVFSDKGAWLGNPLKTVGGSLH
jgi:coproporphyrinogen III oxidase-like Fe-S oxidoreductase